jgi:hypothetical protein
MSDDININVSLPEDDDAFEAARRRLDEGFDTPFKEELSSLRETIDDLTDSIDHLSKGPKTAQQTNSGVTDDILSDNSEDPDGTGTGSGKSGSGWGGKGTWIGAALGGALFGPAGAYLGGIVGNEAGKTTAMLLQLGKELNESVKELTEQMSDVSGVIQVAQAQREVGMLQQNIAMNEDYGYLFANFYNAQTALLLEMRELKIKLYALLLPLGEKVVNGLTWIADKLVAITDYLIAIATDLGILAQTPANDEAFNEDFITAEMFSRTATERLFPRTL